MKKFLTLALAGALVLGLSSVVYANVCAFDPVPAASLLYPFVAFDYNNPINGTTTLFAVTNVSSEAQIVHFTLWSDDTVAPLDWNVVLSGYDVQVMNIRDILYNVDGLGGQLPSTGTESPLVIDGPIPFDNGPVSGSRAPWLWSNTPGVDALPDPDGTNTLQARCPESSLSYPDYPRIDQGFLDLFRSYLVATQEAVKVHESCLGVVGPLTPDDWWQLRSTDEPTWMYITADVVWTCNKLFPDSGTAYWNTPAGGGVAMYDNVLMGDVFWMNADERFSEAGHAVHLEADEQLASVATVDTAGAPISFYYRYSTLANATSDFREPLPTAWAFRYIGVGSATMDTYIRAWKGSTFFSTIVDLDYDGRYIADDCIPYTYYAWDEDENVVRGEEGIPWSAPGEEIVRPNLLPLETQEVKVDQFDTLAGDGWMLFVWPASNFSAPATESAPDFYQTWMGVKYMAFGDYSAARSGVVMANFNCFSNQVMPFLGVGYNYVDDTTGMYVVSPAADPLVYP